MHKSKLLKTLLATSLALTAFAANLSSPSLIGFILMSVSGIAWGFYTLAGRNSTQVLVDTRYNFLISLVFCPLLLLVPIIAAYAGLVFSAETLSLRLVIALVMVLGGMA